MSESAEISEAFAGHEASEPALVTYDQASGRYGPGRHAARDRYDELSGRDHLVRAGAGCGPGASTTRPGTAPGMRSR